MLKLITLWIFKLKLKEIAAYLGKNILFPRCMVKSLSCKSMSKIKSGITIPLVSGHLSPNKGIISCHIVVKYSHIKIRITKGVLTHFLIS